MDTSTISLSSGLLTESASSEVDIGLLQFLHYPIHKMQAAAIWIGQMLIAVSHNQIQSYIFQNTVFLRNFYRPDMLLL